MCEKELEFISEVMQSDGSVIKKGDFVLRNDYGWNLYYEGPGGDIVIPEEFGTVSTTHTFSEIKNIKSLHYPGTKESIWAGDDFGSLDQLERLVFDEGLKKIWGDDFFANCKKLKEVVLPDSLEYLGAGAFKGSPWYRSNIEKEGGCVYLGKFLIDSKKDITEAVVREGTVMICEKAFSGRRNLTSITIPSSVKTIGARAFFNCESLKELRLPESVEKIEELCFAGCSSLKYFEAVNVNLDIAENAFVAKVSKEHYCPDYAYIPFAIPGDGVARSFFAYSYLTSRERFSSELQRINDSIVTRTKSRLLNLILEKGSIAALKNIAPLAITESNIDESISKAQLAGSTQMTTFLMEYKYNVFGDIEPDKQLSSQLNKKRSETALLRESWNTKKLKDGSLGITAYKGADLNVSVPESIGKFRVLVICSEAFSPYPWYKKLAEERIDILKHIESVVVPSGITTIESRAFYRCESLLQITIPKSVVHIGASAYTGCKNLTIHTPAGSYAEQYAKENNIPFVAE